MTGVLNRFLLDAHATGQTHKHTLQPLSLFREGGFKPVTVRRHGNPRPIALGTRERGDKPPVSWTFNPDEIAMAITPTDTRPDHRTGMLPIYAKARSDRPTIAARPGKPWTVDCRAWIVDRYFSCITAPVACSKGGSVRR